MKIVIIGGVAAGTSAAAKARRNDETAEIKIFDMDSDISYSSCGLPYYIGGEVDGREQLVPRDAAFFKKKYNVDVFTRHQVLEINPDGKYLRVVDLQSGREFLEAYDRLVVATGASVSVPGISGVDKQNAFTLRDVNSADRIYNYLLNFQPRRAVIIGSGFIGLEMADNLAARGMEITMVEAAEHVMPPLDRDVSVYLSDYLKEKAVELIVNDTVVEFAGGTYADRVILKSGRAVDTDMIIISTGVRPNVDLAVKAGIELGSTGAIKVNTWMQTNIDGIYACGDCTESFSAINGKPLYRPLGSTANKTGRIAGDRITGGCLEFRGILGTGIFKIFDMTVAMTGLTEDEARRQGYEVAVCHNIKPDRPDYYGGEEMLIKAVADRNTGRVLGAQIVGKAGVDKRIDVIGTAITFGAKAEDLFHLDLAYAPPFSTTKDPVMYTGMILDNAINRGRTLITANELDCMVHHEEKVVILDARTEKQYDQAHVDNAVNIPHERLREQLSELDRDTSVVTYCNKGVTGNAAQNILLNSGFKKVYNLSGGHSNYRRNSHHL